MAALRQVAEMRAAAGDLAGAVDPMLRVMSMPTQDAALLSLAVKIFLGTANYAEAFRYAGELAALDPGDMTARVQAVEAQYRMGQVEPAMRAAEEALKRHPGDLAMLVALGTMQVEMGPGRKTYGQALAQALKLKPDYAPALYLSGRKAQLEGDFRDAEKAFAKVLKSDPENYKALGQLGMAQYHLGKSVAAERSFREVVSRNPSDYNTWYNLGELLLGRANEETSSEAVRRFRAEALECYLKSIDLNPELAQARYRVGVLMIGNGQYKEAIRHLDGALRVDARHVPTLVQLALAYEYLKQPDRARAYLNLWIPARIAIKSDAPGHCLPGRFTRARVRELRFRCRRRNPSRQGASEIYLERSCSLIPKVLLYLLLRTTGALWGTSPRKTS
jgi:tetratricopeptide (TPR) repeat protein